MEKPTIYLETSLISYAAGRVSEERKQLISNIVTPENLLAFEQGE